jgi:hypothetical protein
MRGHMRRTLLAAAAAGSAAFLMAGLAGPSAAAAAAHVRDPIYTTSQAGYVTGGGPRFRYIATTVRVAPAQKFLSYAEVVLGGRGVTLYTTLVVRAGGGIVGWTIGAPPFGMEGGSIPNVAPKVGDLVRLSLYFKAHSGTWFTATDITQGVSGTFHAPASATAHVFTAAEAAGVISNPSRVPPGSTRLWAFRNTRVTTSSGVHGTMLGPWTTTKIVDLTPSGRIVYSPSPLWHNGQNFGAWLR